MFKYAYPWPTERFSARALLMCLLSGYSLFIVRDLQCGAGREEKKVDIWILHKDTYCLNEYLELEKEIHTFWFIDAFFWWFFCCNNMKFLWINAKMHAFLAFALFLFQWQSIMFSITKTCYSKCNIFEQYFIFYKLSEDLTPYIYGSAFSTPRFTQQYPWFT